MLNIFLLSAVYTISLKILTALWFLSTAFKTKIGVKYKQNMEQLATVSHTHCPVLDKMKLLLLIILQIQLVINHPTWKSLDQEDSSLKYSQTGVETINEKVYKNFEVAGGIKKV